MNKWIKNLYVSQFVKNEKLIKEMHNYNNNIH